MSNPTERKVIPYHGAGWLPRPLTAQDEQSIEIILDFLHSESSEAVARADGLISCFPDYVKQAALDRFRKEQTKSSLPTDKPSSDL